MIHNFRELNVWQQSMDFTMSIYEITKLFPPNEIYGLTSQLQRASVSIPTNIAEGSGRISDKDLVHFLSFSLSSACEVETELILAHNLKYINDENFDILSDKVIQIQKMLFALIKRYS